MPAQAQRGRSEARASSLGELLRLLKDAAVEHKLSIYASAIAFRALVAAIPLALLGLGLLGALGLRDTWRNSIAPGIKPHVAGPVFDAINYTATRVLTSGTAGLIALASALVLWDMTLGIFAVMDALNRIHDVEERRSLSRRAATAVTLAAASALAIVLSILVVTVAPRIGSGGIHFVLGVGRWLVAPTLLAIGVGMLFRFAPAERPETRWASAGSLLVIGTWLGASICFRVWVTSVANFKSATGSLTVLLVLTSYLFVLCAIFLLGAQLDELIRKQTHHQSVSVVTILRRRLRR